MDTTTRPSNTTTVADALRALADQIEAADVTPTVRVYMRFGTDDRDQAVAEVAAVARAFGPVTKDGTDWDFVLESERGPVTVKAMWRRKSVCEQQTVTKTETVTEWVCPDSFLALADAVNAGAVDA